VLYGEEEIMRLSVGDKVVFPRRGIGQITGLESLDLVEGFERYYVIEIPDGLTVRVPVKKATELGLRPVMSRAKLARVLSELGSSPRLLSEDYRERQGWVRERLATGAPIRIARIVRDLTWHERRAHLTQADTDLLTRGRDFLSAEIAIVTGTEVIDARQTINDALVAASTNVPDLQKSET
jgi:CarD family transcriptional regulator